MTRLRHDRPILRYLDNLRREAGSPDLLSSAPQPNKSPMPTPGRLLRSRNEQAYERHIEAFDRLPEQSRLMLDRLFAQASELLTARVEYIESLGTRKNVGKKQARYDQELDAFRRSCIDYNQHCASEARDGKSTAREWFAKLRVVMGSEWVHFEDMDQTIAETRRA